MSGKRHDDREVQETYARWLDLGTRAAFVFCAAAFAAYLLGLVAPLVPLSALPSLWSLPAGEYVARTGGAAGWTWLALARYADYANVLGISLFAAVSAVALARVVPLFARRGEKLHAALAAAQVLVLLAAASGWFAGGG